MRKIILASRSRARRRLLRRMGLKFKTAESNARESGSLKSGAPRLVMDNAVRKARDVAARFDSGVVIAADTVVLAGRRIIGKPKDAPDAFRTLKTLSRAPQWVYTGLAVIDIDNKKTFTAYERTRIYMRPLSGREIIEYLRKASPMDKAGSFDIDGPGGALIDRIEGCFYNVVGLPLTSLAKMLKKTGVEIDIGKLRPFIVKVRVNNR